MTIPFFGRMKIYEDPFFEANSWGVNDEFYPLAW